MSNGDGWQGQRGRRAGGACDAAGGGGAGAGGGGAGGVDGAEPGAAVAVGVAGDVPDAVAREELEGGQRAARRVGVGAVVRHEEVRGLHGGDGGEVDRAAAARAGRLVVRELAAAEREHEVALAPRRHDGALLAQPAARERRVVGGRPLRAAQVRGAVEAPVQVDAVRRRRQRALARRAHEAHRVQRRALPRPHQRLAPDLQVAHRAHARARLLLRLRHHSRLPVCAAHYTHAKQQRERGGEGKKRKKKKKGVFVLQTIRSTNEKKMKRSEKTKNTKKAIMQSLLLFLLLSPFLFVFGLGSSPSSPSSFFDNIAILQKS